jgi:hypothetical protein
MTAVPFLNDYHLPVRRPIERNRDSALSMGKSEEGYYSLHT